ncbi:MAG: hypothetical protein ACLP8Y_08810 [Thermoplasmata archaeon]
MTVTTTSTYGRPLGVAILAVLVGLFGVLIIIGGLLLLAAATIPSFLGVPSSFVGESGALWGVIVLIIGLIILGLALGLWHLRMWALVLTLIFVFIELVSFAIAGNFVSLGFILSLIIFVYLIAVNRHFR